MPDATVHSAIDSETITRFLASAARFLLPPSEKTLFSLGGRGHYENPASDLLAFFLQPEAEHGFGSFFLTTFLGCMGVDSTELAVAELIVLREAPTSLTNRIDILVKGTNWALLIETKIHHHANDNPFQDYEDYAHRLQGCNHLLFAFLARATERSVPPNWKQVTWESFCAQLKQNFAQAVFNLPFSKWIVFAREFILHFENELRNPTMTSEELDFMEQNLIQAEHVQKMLSGYNEEFAKELTDRLNNAVPEHKFYSYYEDWTWRCKDTNCAQWDFAVQTPAGRLNPTGKFLVRIYLHNLNSTQSLSAFQALTPTMDQIPCGGFDYWNSRKEFDSRTAAFDEVCRIARLLAGLWSA